MVICICWQLDMPTMGPKLTSLIRPMITGYEDLEDPR